MDKKRKITFKRHTVLHFYAISMIYEEEPDQKPMHIWQIYVKKAIFLSKGKPWQALHTWQNQKIRKINVRKHLNAIFSPWNLFFQFTFFLPAPKKHYHLSSNIIQLKLLNKKTEKKNIFKHNIEKKDLAFWTFPYYVKWCVH